MSSQTVDDERFHCLTVRKYSFTASAEREIVRVVNEKLCYSCLDYDTEHKSTVQVHKERPTFSQTGTSSLSALTVSIA